MRSGHIAELSIFDTSKLLVIETHKCLVVW